MVTSRIRERYFWAMTHYLKPNHLPAYGDGSLAEISHSRVQNRPLLVSAGRKAPPAVGAGRGKFVLGAGVNTPTPSAILSPDEPGRERVRGLPPTIASTR